MRSELGSFKDENFYLFLRLVNRVEFRFGQVFFQALDLRVKNVAFAYSLEHLAIYEHFDLVFHWLDAILDDSTEYEPFQELGFCAGTVEKFVCQHMLKEEEQVTYYYHIYALLVLEMDFANISLSNIGVFDLDTKLC